MAPRQSTGISAAFRAIRVAALLWAVLAIPRAAAGAIDGAGTEVGTALSLAVEVERLVEQTKPGDWALRRACLYYAFAGQYLLAQQGIAALVWVGAVVYDPGTAVSHQIWPHAWRETATHLIDYSALPRWGRVRVIPLHRVARAPAEVTPGTTGVLALRRLEDLDLVAYLAAHRERFDRGLKGDR